jgi:hypothetical protein
MLSTGARARSAASGVRWAAAAVPVATRRRSLLARITSMVPAVLARVRSASDPRALRLPFVAFTDVASGTCQPRLPRSHEGGVYQCPRDGVKDPAQVRLTGLEIPSCDPSAANEGTRPDRPGPLWRSDLKRFGDLLLALVFHLPEDLLEGRGLRRDVALAIVIVIARRAAEGGKERVHEVAFVLTRFGTGARQQRGEV